MIRATKLNSVLLFVLTMFCAFLVFGYGRTGGVADPSFRNDGNQAVPFAVTLDAGSSTLVYEPLDSAVDQDRRVLIQNTNLAFDVYCGTHSAVLATSGPRWFIRRKMDFIAYAQYPIYCITESGTFDVLGVVHYDQKD